MLKVWRPAEVFKLSSPPYPDRGGTGSVLALGGNQADEIADVLETLDLAGAEADTEALLGCGDDVEVVEAVPVGYVLGGRAFADGQLRVLEDLAADLLQLGENLVVRGGRHSLILMWHSGSLKCCRSSRQ